MGQYQHDVNQLQLAQQLDAVVEDCVNAVGVDVNTASAPLLARVSGLSASVASNVVSLREENGPYLDRAQLKSVRGLGERSFEQAAGFLRIMGGDNPLDASAVHPESYPLVEKIARESGRELKSLVGDSAFLRSLSPQDFVSGEYGLPTVSDILQELDKPGRDPRPGLRVAKLQDGVEKISDLREDMVLEGTVTNVTNFGAFVDVGVHQDGLVHISALANKFVKDPREVVKAGDIVKVKVMSVDVQRKRIGLSMRLDDRAAEAAAQDSGRGEARKPRKQRPGGKQGRSGEARGGNAMADAFARARSQ